jgi:hypothetical protein
MNSMPVTTIRQGITVEQLRGLLEKLDQMIRAAEAIAKACHALQGTASAVRGAYYQGYRDGATRIVGYLTVIGSGEDEELSKTLTGGK